jgi:hypothetical protein
VISKSPVASDELHITGLSLAGVEEHTFLVPAITVTKPLTALTCEQENVRRIARCRNSTLVLPTKDFMDIDPSAIDLTYLEQGLAPWVAP